MTGLLAPVFQDVTDGYAEVRETFKLPSGDVVAGLYVLDGKITRNSPGAGAAQRHGDVAKVACSPSSASRMMSAKWPPDTSVASAWMDSTICRTAIRSSSSIVKKSHGPKCVDPVELRRSGGYRDTTHPHGRRDAA